MKVLGKIRSAHGVQGELLISHTIREASENLQLPALMIELLPGSFIPFFVESMQPAGENLWLVKFENINNREEAQKLITKKVALPPTVDLELEPENPWLDLLHFQLLDSYRKPVGTITDILSNGPQVLLEVKGEKEFLIPISNELIVGTDTVKKQISLHIAEGLLDI